MMASAIAVFVAEQAAAQPDVQPRPDTEPQPDAEPRPDKDPRPDRAPAGALVPPRVRSDTSVRYPPEASGDATVILELTIAPDGTVQVARATSGREPFGSVAAAAARGWRFSPATRDGAPVAARIRFELTFRAPAVAPEAEPETLPDAAKRPTSEETDAASPPGKPAPPKAPSTALEVTVTADRPAPGRQVLTRAEARQLPGAFGDPLRAVEVLPGVTPIVSGLPYFFIRGAPPGNVGYFLDGVRVPALYHLGAGPSVLNPGLIERVDLYSGGYPAQYGRYAGGIVAAETTRPRADLHGEANVRLIDAGGFVETGFAEGRGTALVGGRYSYTGLVLSLVAPDVDLEYWDYQSRITYDVGKRTTLGVFAFGGFDFLGETVDGEKQTAFSTEFHRLDLRLSHEASRHTRLDVAATFGIDRGDLGSEDVRSVDRIVGTRGRVRHRVNDNAELRLGYDVTLDFFELERDLSADDGVDNGELFPSRRDQAFGIWLAYPVDVHQRVSLTPGIRADLFTSEGAAAIGVDPRLSALFKVKRNLRLIHTLGLAHQPPSYTIPLPGLVPSGLEDGLQQSVQSSSGVEWDLPKLYTLTATAFQTAFFNTTDNLDPADFNVSEEVTIDENGNEVIDNGGNEGPTTEKLKQRSLGSAVGVELGLRRPITQRLGGFVSYTLSRSLRSFRRSKAPANFDRTHVFNFAAGYDLGKRWRAGSRVVLYSGLPSSRRNPDGTRIRHPDRVAPFFRLDVRLEKRWSLGKRGYWAFVFEVLNATATREAISDACDDEGCRVERIGPLTFPNVGVEAFF